MTSRQGPSIREALEEALKASPPADQDAGTVALARRYASELDDAKVVSVRISKALRQLSKAEVSEDLYDKFVGLAARIEHTHVLATIGPKLLASLTELRLTPAARGAIMAPPSTGKTQLDELRERKERRGQGSAS